MMLPGNVIEAPAGLRGFDANQFISPQTAKELRDHGYRYAIRYVPRRKANPADLSRSEAAGILASGLGLQVVQHVQMPGWVPTGEMGIEYGVFAARSAEETGYRFGGMLWCDLEGVKPHTNPQDVIAFCNNWHERVGHAGYTPGLYVGYDPGLSGTQLYKNLRFEHYWSAYNLNTDQFPITRGVQMKQGTEKVVAGIRLDPDEIQADALGGLPLMHVDNEWTA